MEDLLLSFGAGGDWDGAILGLVKGWFLDRRSALHCGSFTDAADISGGSCGL